MESVRLDTVACHVCDTHKKRESQDRATGRQAALELKRQDGRHRGWAQLQAAQSDDAFAL